MVDIKVEYIDHMGDDLRVVSDLSYLAGLIDADGHVGLHKVDRERYAPSLSFVNTDRGLIDFFQKYLKGKVYIKKKLKETHSTTYEVIVRDANELTAALDLIIPFLRLKKGKACVIKDYAISILENSNKKVSYSVKQERLRLRNLWENTLNEYKS